MLDAINGITPSALWTALAVIVLLCGVVSIVLGAVEKINAIRLRKSKPAQSVSDEIAEINRKLSTDKARLDDHTRTMTEHDGKLADLRTGLMATCTGVQALLEHELHNGNADEMQQASKGIEKWLRERG